MRFAIIGAGVAGLCSAHYIKKEFPDAEVVVFEATDNVGGTWNYSEETKDKEFDIPSMTSMYKNLRTNLPKEIMAFSDFPIPESSDTFMTDEDFLEYLKKYAQHFDLERHVKFRHMVTSVKVVEGGWDLAYRDLRGGVESRGMFDYVYVCNGHYNRVFIPEYKGRELFKGGQVHSHNYRRPEHYRGKSVLVIGAGPSAQDISIDVARQCSALFLSHHSPTFPSPYPPHFHQKPDVREFTEDSVVFVDGTTEKIDEILYCTGYGYYTPFLDESCGIHVERTHIRYLYRHMVNIEHPTMFFIGVPQLCCAVPLMDMQARYTIAAIKGIFKFPSRDDMMTHWREKYEMRKKLQRKKYDTHNLGGLEAGYYGEINAESGVKTVPRVFCSIREDTMQNKANLYTYRNYKYKIIDENTFEKIFMGENNHETSKAG